VACNAQNVKPFWLPKVETEIQSHNKIKDVNLIPNKKNQT